MFIQEVILDGFKSYAKRTVVSGFDPEFNAITGLNGSGKSNILDAICFVLGISNLSQVRAGSLAELVYKRGQAGVTKASVTLVFNNSDPAQSPVGYEHCETITVTRQIAIGGRNKYYLNGTVATATRVQNLFHSVHLNVNNPHFLIMQGRITKVLNMKPAETLGMLEEAAGTSMFESKKALALRTIGKKEAKVAEITKALAEDITPQIRKLEQDRRQYEAFQSATAKAERLARFILAYDYVQKKKLAERARVESDSARQRKREADMAAEKAARAEKGAEKAVKRAAGERAARAGADYEEASAEEAARSKDLAVVRTELENARRAAEEASADAHRASEAAIALEESVAALEKGAADAAKRAEEAEGDASEAEVREARAQEAVQAAAAGMALGGDGHAGTVTGRLTAARARVGEMRAKAEADAMTATSLRSEAKRAAAAAARGAKEAETLDGKATALEEEVEAMQAAVEELGGGEGDAAWDAKVEKAREDVEAKTQEARAAEEKYEEAWGRVSGALEFDYNVRAMPRGFRASSIRGVLAKLVTVRDPASTTALEVAAGGKLFQVVVDKAETGKVLLQKGCASSKRRVTIIPLDRVTSGSMPAGKVDAARRATKGAAVPALELVDYDEDVAKAVEYALGMHMVCPDAEAAHKVAFGKGVGLQAVTMAGDYFDPRGTLEGGSKAKREGVLSVLARVRALQEAAQAKLAAADEAKAVLKELEAARSKVSKLTAALEVKKTAAEAARERANGCESAEMVRRARDAEKEAAEKEAAAEEAMQAVKAAEEEVEALEAEDADADAKREEEEAEAKAELERAKRHRKEARERARDAVREADEAKAELEHGRGELEAAQKAVERAKEEAARASEQREELTRQFEVASSAHEAAANALDALRSALAEADAGVAEADEARREAAAARDEAEATSRHESREAEKWERAGRAAERHVADVAATQEWIAAEEAFFGKSGTEYDFEARDPAEAREELEALEAEQRERERGLNPRVLQMMEEVTREYNELTRKRDVITKDRERIQAVIHELDAKKRDALVATWKKVNRDFGSIFSTLLPGAHARLDPVTAAKEDAEDGEEEEEEVVMALEGLNVRVSFSDVDKGLTELSGGQRSLLALSLILALLLFKPAPMYILDEVDAALDLSHTQNIGHMLKRHFKGSQFIIVSLKQGMFSNANTIFRTKFVDGTSTVTRTSNTHAVALRDAEDAAEAAAAAEKTADASSSSSSSSAGSAGGGGRRGRKAAGAGEEESGAGEGAEAEASAAAPRGRRATRASAGTE